MAIAYGARAGSDHGNTNAAQHIVTTSASIPAGSLIVVSVSGSNVGDTNNLASVTDSAGNTYQSAGFTCDGGQNTLTAVWYSKTGNALASGGTVTVNFNTALLNSGESWEITVDYLTGADMTSPVDQTNTRNSQTGATWDTNSITTTVADTLVWVTGGTNQGGNLSVTNAGSTPTSGWTVLARVSGGAGNNNQIQSAYQVFSATGTYKGGGTTSAGNNGTSAVVIAFKAASGGSNTLSGSVAARGTMAGSLSVEHDPSGAVHGRGTLSGTLSVERDAAGAVHGRGTLSASLSVEHDLIGAAQGRGTLSGTLSVERDLTGAIHARGTLSGTLSVSGSGNNLSGAVAGRGTLSGTLAVTRLLSGAITGRGTLSGSLGGARNLSGTITARGTLTGTLSITKPLSGSISGRAVLTGSVHQDQFLAGTIHARGTLVGLLGGNSGFLIALVSVAFASGIDLKSVDWAAAIELDTVSWAPAPTLKAVS